MAAADHRQLRRHFAEARAEPRPRRRGADRRPTCSTPRHPVTQATSRRFQPLVQTLIARVERLRRPGLPVNGDSHVYNSGPPAGGRARRGCDFYGVTGSADNLTRVTVDGSDNNKDWLKVTANKAGPSGVLSFERIAFTRPAR